MPDIFRSRMTGERNFGLDCGRVAQLADPTRDSSKKLTEAEGLLYFARPGLSSFPRPNFAGRGQREGCLVWWSCKRPLTPTLSPQSRGEGD